MPEFYAPNKIIQYAEYPDQNISWTNNARDSDIINQPDYNFANAATGAGDKNVLSTVKTLTHIPNPTRGPRLDKTYYLKCTDFGLGNLPNAVTGFSLTIYSQRNGKIVDDVVSLTYNGEIIGDNKTNISAIREGHLTNNNEITYGGPTDMWGAEITKTMMQDPSFGVVLRFGSNPLYPHNCGMQIYKILLTVHPFNVFVFDENTDIEFISEQPIADYFISE